MTYDIDEHAFYNTFGQEVVDVVFLEDVYKAANRYEALRKLTPQEFTKLWKRSLTGEKTFDSLVDELIV